MKTTTKNGLLVSLLGVVLIVLLIAAASPNITTNVFSSVQIKRDLVGSNATFSGTFSATVPLATWASHVDGANVSNAVATAANVTGLVVTASITVVTNGTDTMTLKFTNGVLRAIAVP